MKEAFTAVTKRVRPRLEYIARRARGEDPQNVVAEVIARTWRAFPRLHEQNAAAVAMGQAAPHTAEGYALRAAHSLVIDEYRRRLKFDNALGRRAMREMTLEEQTRRALRSSPAGTLPRASEPLGIDYVVDERVPLTEDWYERKESMALLGPALRSLPKKQRTAIWAWANQVPYALTARRLRCSRFTLMRLHRSALEGLRAFYRAHGYDCPTTQYVVRLRVKKGETE